MFQVDKYITASPANFISRSYANLLGRDLFFYVSDTNELRVKDAASPNFHLLQVDVKWVSTIPAYDRVHVYFSDMYDNINYLMFQTQNFITAAPQNPVGIAGETFSACMTTVDTDYYLLLVDDGMYFTLYSATDPQFTNTKAAVQVYNKIIDRGYFTTRPMLAVHPEDTNRITITCERTEIATSETKVGFFVTTVPGT